MKHIIILCIFIFFHFSSNGQAVTESIYGLSLNSSSIFSLKSGKMNFNFVRTYTLGKADTAYILNINISSKTAEKTGYVLGFSEGLGFGGSTNYEINKTSEFTNLEKAQFFELYKCISSSFLHMEKNKTTYLEKVTTSCTISNITFGIEFDPSGKDTMSYYFRYANTVYLMYADDFKNIINLLNKSKAYYI